jgi:hypothetical protein
MHTQIFISQGLPMGAVQNAMQRDGLDPSIMDLDHNKSVASQQKKDDDEDGPPLKDDPKYQKYFKVIFLIIIVLLLNIFAHNPLSTVILNEIKMLKMVRTTACNQFDSRRMKIMLMQNMFCFVIAAGPSKGCCSKCHAKGWLGPNHNGS